METSNLNIRYDDSNEKALNGLFEAFGSTFSIQDITSAYHKANKNADLAGEMLGRTSTSLELASSGKPIFMESSRPVYGNAFGKSHQMNKNFRASKQKWSPVSGGTVSSILGKDYVKPIPIASGHMRTKPTKLDTKLLPASVLWGKEAGLNLSKNGQMQKDIEDFLFRMLGDGFQLEKDVIQQVLDNCGYDMQKSMEKLLDLPAVNMDQGHKCLTKSTEKTLEVHSNSEHPATQKLVPAMSSNGGGANGVSNLSAKGITQQEKRNDLQKEVLHALFNAVDESEVSIRRARAGRRSRALGELVVEPPQDFASERKSESVVSKQENNDDEDDEEDAYQKLRTAVKEYRATMKEYYKAAVAAFAEGDHDLANKLMDQGQFFHDKAQKADEESRQRIFETKNVDTQDEVTLDLHDHGAKEAYRLLKHHLSLFSGIASIKYLRVITETDEVDTSKGARRRLVMKLLEKESIEWNEGENAGTILIRMDNINRKALSFAKA